jgi:hypothetical protein
MEGCDLLCEELNWPVIIEWEGAPFAISDGQKALITLGSKFCVYERCNEEKFLTNVETLMCRMRMPGLKKK